MESLIAGFNDQLKEALAIGQNASLTPSQKPIENVLITGLGGSGIGGTIIKDWLSDSCQAPIIVNKGYGVPGFVNENTLVIASSYSGNTEETLSATEKAIAKGAQIAAITSGGELEQMVENVDGNIIKVPGGNPPRAMLAYSLVQQLFLFNHYGLANVDIEKEINTTRDILEFNEKEIKREAKDVAKGLKNTSPYIYSLDGYSGIGTRMRQQLNENSKMLCNSQVIPEMNHNELVGWAGAKGEISVVFLRNEDELDRNRTRLDINEEIIQKYTSNIHHIWSKGDTRIQRSLYHIHLEDWCSLYLSELNGVDPVEIEVINHLKGELSKL